MTADRIPSHKERAQFRELAPLAQHRQRVPHIANAQSGALRKLYLQLATVTDVITPSPDTVLHPLVGEPRALHEWLTTFHLLSVVVDPYTNESAWVLKTAQRVLAQFSDSGVRTNYVVTGTKEEARNFLGPFADQVLVFCDPERTYVKQLALKHLPALVFLRMDGHVVSHAEGWNPLEWRTVTEMVARTVVWSKPLIPAPGDPGAFVGTPALV